MVSYKDLGAGLSHAVYGLNVHFERLRFNELSRFSAEMVLRNKWGDNISDMEIKGAGHVNFADFEWQNFALRSLRTQVYLFQKPVDILLDLDNLRTPYFNIKASVPAFEDKDLSLFHAEKGRFSIPKATLTAKGVLTNGYRLLKLNQLTANAADVKLTASGAVDFEKAPFEADLQVSTNFFNLAGKEKYYPLMSKYKLTGQGSLAGRITHTSGKYALPLVTAQVKDASALLYGFKADNITGEFQAKKILPICMPLQRTER